MPLSMKPKELFVFEEGRVAQHHMNISLDTWAWVDRSTTVTEGFLLWSSLVMFLEQEIA